MFSRDVKKVPTLRGKTVVNLFFEPSTRTRVSFEVAEKRMSADTINISGASSSAVKGETLIDTVKNIKALNADIVVVRHPLSGAVQRVADEVDIAVINAGDGSHAHPTQALLDAYTIRQHKDSFEGLTVAIVGDIRHSRVARSNIWALTKLGAKVRVVGPTTMIPVQVEQMGVDVCYDLNEGIADADVVLMLRIQKERQNDCCFASLREYASLYGLRDKSLKFMKEDALIMHPGPVNLGVEISQKIVDSERSLILDQVTNGVAVRMAALYLVASQTGGAS